MAWMKGRLVDKDGRTVNVGDDVVDFRGNMARVTGWDSPRHAGSTGRVCVREDDGGEREYFPSVYGLRIEVEED